MKVLIICKALEHVYSGGIQSHVTDLSASLSMRGHDVHIVTAGNPVWRGVRENSNVKVSVLPYWSRKWSFGLQHYLGDLSFNMLVNLWVQLYGKQFDVIHIHGRSGIMLHKVKIGVPVVQTIHGIVQIEQQLSKSAYKSNRDRALHMKWAEVNQERMTQFSNALIAVSKNTARNLMEYHGAISGRKIHVIPNGVLSTSCEHIAAGDEHSMLFVGRLSEAKGLDILINAMKFLDNRITLKVIGDGPLRKVYGQMTQELGVDDRVSFMGQQSRSEVATCMKQAFVVIAPSKYEPQGIVMLEAAALGKTIIAANTHGVPEFLEDRVNGIMTHSGSPEELACAIVEVHANPELAASMGARAKLKVTFQYQWDYLYRQVLNVYKSCAA